MSTPSGDWTPPNDGGQGGPMDDAAAILAKSSRLSPLTPDQVERTLRQLSVPFESLPQVPFFLRPFGGHTQEWQKAQIARVLAASTVHLGRQLTTEEADALAYHRSRLCSRLAWAPPAWMAITVLLLRRGQKSFRFPFYTPKPASFNPTYFPARARPLITGRPAVITWHLLRAVAYAIPLNILVTSIFQSFSETSYIVSVLADPKLKAIREAATRPRDRRHPAQTSRVPHRFPQGEGMGSSQPTPSQSYRQEYDGSATWDTPEQQQQQQRPPQWPQGAPESQGALENDDPFLFDDASPVAPGQRQPQRPSASSASSTGEGSAWERLRQRAQSGEAGQIQGDQRGQSRGQQQTTEQYTYSQSERDKAYAREQAQKEFDAMLERERRGLGDSGGSGGSGGRF
ncbi:hypothetical protein VTK56DRAFT_2915 [Thermocarpiscus australiensis]